ncbi:MAG TPA: hypothetical protein VLE96_06125 [Chlamydiales bacterium]|nr:hypothetical protein [Chlamydiales bacterium]
MATRIYIIFIFCLSIFTLPAFAQSADGISQRREPDAKDMDALRRWLQDKRLVTMREIGGDLSLSGEVRTEFQATSEERNGNQVRGGGGPRPMFAWDVEFNLMLDYRADRTWAAIKIEYDNDMGIRSGTFNKIRLEKAYLGARLVPGDTFTMDGEIGRRYLSNVFESKIEFSSVFDGALLRFSKAAPSVGDFITQLGAFVVNDRTNHYGFVVEIGALRIANVGLNLKYSIIDWDRPGGENEKDNTIIETQLTNLRFRYLVSQFLASYQFYPGWMGKKLVKFYGAALVNHLALSNPLATVGIENQPFGKQNWGWYTGVSLGTLKKKYDWAVDANFQWVQAQAVPGFDCSGIGRGNAGGVGLYTKKADGSGGPVFRDQAVGSTNFYGFSLDGSYLFTDNMTINPLLQCSWTLDHDIGPNLMYKQFEVEFIYAF